MPSNPDSLEVVQVDKQESTALGGDDTDAAEWGSTPINPTEDAPEVAGIFFVESGDSRPIKTRSIWPDGNNLRFKDINNPGTGGGGYTLTELLSGSGGLTESQHKALRQLIHFLPDGPGPGWGSGPNYKETTYDGLKPTAEVWWETSSKSKKIFSVDTTYTGIKPSTETFKVYDTDGSTVLAQAVDAITYSGLLETSRTRTITVY